MTITAPAVASLDAGTVTRLGEAFRRCLETGDADEGVFTPDAFFDIYPPFWRFQLEGPAAFGAQLRSIAQGDVTVTAVRLVAAESGFVLETDETHRGDTVVSARHLWLCEVRDGRIAAAVGYCNGGWDDELRARHAAEAPMLRP